MRRIGIKGHQVALGFLGWASKKAIPFAPSPALAILACSDGRAGCAPRFHGRSPGVKA